MASPIFRQSSGKLLFQDFSTLVDGNLNGQGGWVVDTGTWTVTGGIVTTDGTNYARARQTQVSAAVMAVQVRAQFPSHGSYFGTQLIADPSGVEIDYQSFVTDNDGQLNYYLPAGSGHAIASISGSVATTNTWYCHTVGYANTGVSSRSFEFWLNTLRIGPDFQASSGLAVPTTGQPGLMAYGPTASWSKIAVATSVLITVGGLTGMQGWRLFDGSSTVIGSSAVQSGGVATISLGGQFWPFTGYVQVYDDAGTWAKPTTGGRWPGTGTATDIWGGDVYDLPSLSTIVVQVNWDDDQTWPTKWTAAGKDVSADVKEIHTVTEAANPDVRQDTCTIVLDDPNGNYIPANVSGSHYPNVRLNREVRVLAVVSGVTQPWFYGRIAEFHPKTRRDATPRNCTIRVESPLRAIVASQSTLYPVPVPQVVTPSASGVLVDASGTVGVIPTLLNALGDLVPAANWSLQATPDTTEDVASLYTTVPEALQQLALMSDSIYGVHPQYRTTSAGVDWLFFWQARGALVGALADHTYNTESGDVDDADFRFTGDWV